MPIWEKYQQQQQRQKFQKKPNNGFCLGGPQRNELWGMEKRMKTRLCAGGHDELLR